MRPRHSSHFTTRVHAPEVSSEHLSYDKASLTFATEASDLDCLMGDGNWMRGFHIRSRRTGQLEYFAYDGVQRREGEAIMWTFVPTTSHLKELTVHVYND